MNQNPRYRLHKASRQAIVTLNSKDIYLGPHGTAASKREYDRVIGEWLARGRQQPATVTVNRVADVILAYWNFAQGYYGDPGNRTELGSVKLALSVLRRCYGQTPANEFGPLALQVVRDRMIKDGWSRNYVNSQIKRVKRCFKWACSRELVPPSIFHGLQSVGSLKKGKTEARETDPVKPVPEAWVDATLPHVSRQVEAMIRLQLAAGCRPGEACIMRGCDLDTTGKVWAYRPQHHKTEHHGHDRVIYLGPQAQEIIRPFLKTDLQAYLFSPAEAEAERREEQAKSRKTPLNQGNTPGSNRRRRPGRKPSNHYTVDSYRRAIANGCDAAFSPPDGLTRRRVKGDRGKRDMRWETGEEWRKRLGEKWATLEQWRAEHRWHPHQLRHNAATRLRKQYGLEAARVVLGQKSGAVAEIYAEIDLSKAEKIMAEVG